MAFNLFKKVGDFLYDHRQFLVPLPKELREYSAAARTQRTTLGQKFKDTFFAFAGKVRVSDLNPGERESLLGAKSPRMGIFDYLTLGIPLLATKLFYAADYFKRKDYTLLARPVAILGFIANIILLPLRYLVATVATIAVSPVVLVTQFYSKIVGSKEYNEALEIPIEAGGTYLRDYLALNQIDASDLRLTALGSIRNSENVATKIVLRLSPKGQLGNESTPTFQFTIPVPQQKENEPEAQTINDALILSGLTATGLTREQGAKRSIQAALNLNMFKLNSRILEKSDKVATLNTTEHDEIEAALAGIRQ